MSRAHPSALFAIALALSPVAVAAQDAGEGQALYLTYCASCHGDEARGDGPMRDLLTIWPADLTVLSANNGGDFPRFQVARQVDGRDPVMAHGGPMPFYGDVFEGESVVMQSRTGQPIVMGQGIADLIVFLETLQQ